ncbi:MAG: hypothetical protein SFX18_13600 [Pirellulales bacterium]|nr:hypothetical protein [Pirellulales bacterium]
MEHSTSSPSLANRRVMQLIALGLVVWGSVHAVGVWWGGTGKDKFAGMPVDKDATIRGMAETISPATTTTSNPPSVQTGWFSWPIARAAVVVVCTALFLLFWGGMLFLRKPRLPRYRVAYPPSHPLPETPPCSTAAQ